jgi:hypothetical protein
MLKNEHVIDAKYNSKIMQPPSVLLTHPEMTSYTTCLAGRRPSEPPFPTHSINKIIIIIIIM